MNPNRNWILVIAGAICIGLVLLGIMSYPSDNHDPLELLAYSIGIPLCTIGILLLINFRGLPNSSDSFEQHE